MRTGIITDVHGNVPALDVILARLEREGVDRIVCLGDVVGYGANPNACVERVRAVAQESVLGNHDAAVSSRMDVHYATEQGRRLVEQARDDLSRASLRWLTRRPLSLEDGAAVYMHGVPPNPRDYKYLLSLQQARVLSHRVDVLAALTFIGHSHLERGYRLWKGGATELSAGSLELTAGHKYVINVGSVGQPRDRDPRAAAAVYDDDRGTVRFVRETYDVAEAARRIRAADLPETFARRLFSGW